MSTTHIYIAGATFEQVVQATTHAGDAHDPFNYFGFCGSDSFQFTTLVPIEKRSDANSIVVAYKDGAAASYYANELRERFRQVGLSVFVTADLDEAIDFAQSSAVSIRESVPLTRAQWRALERIATETGSLAERGDNAGNPSWRTLLRRIADGELMVKGND